MLEAEPGRAAAEAAGKQAGAGSRPAVPAAAAQPRREPLSRGRQRGESRAGAPTPTVPSGTAQRGSLERELGRHAKL